MSVKEAFEAMSYGPAPEAPEVALEWIQRAAQGPGCKLFINGSFTAPATGEYFDTLNPANGQVLASVAQAGPTDVDHAVRAARDAQKDWAALPGFERARYLYALARQIQKHSRLFAVLESLDNGKPICETRDIDVPLVARHFYYHAGWAQLAESELRDYEPVGVAAQIIPWNFPLLMLAWKIAPAIALGNTVVLKPAEYTPLTALLFGEICQAVGLPPGVVNVITGDGATGKLLVEHPDVDKVAFTGSTEVGRIIRKATAGTGKKLSLELGGKSPFVVFEDADFDGAVEGIVDAIWFNQGQVCCAGSRLLVQEGIAEDFLTRLRRRMENLRVGNPLDKAIDIGAIIAPVQLDRINELVTRGCEEGAELFQPSWACPSEGWFYPPTLLTKVGPASTVAQVEIFGPVLVAMTFRTPDEAVELANNTVYGLAASVWSENINQALHAAARIKAGTVWVNSTNVFDAASGFGGYRESGFGREGGREGLYEYLKPRKAVVSPEAPPHLMQTATERGPQNARAIDRTHKLYIGGKQVRPDGGYSLAFQLQDGASVEIARGNRKDIRNAVEAAHTASKSWSRSNAHLRAQILFYLGENLAGYQHEFTDLLLNLGYADEDAKAEVDASVRRCFEYAAWADKYESAVHQTAQPGITYTLHDPLGVIGIICPDERPLLGLLSLVLPAVATGNTVVAVPSERHPVAAAELYRIVESSDIPAGVLNIVTGLRAELEKPLAQHDSVDAVWHFGSAEGGEMVERESIGNLKQTWVGLGENPGWLSSEASGREFLRRSVQVKNIWVPYGE